METAIRKLQANWQSLAIILLCAIVGLASTFAIFDQPIIGAGIIYVVAFLVIAWRRPDVALMLCFALAPLQNDLSGDSNTESHGKFSVCEINIMLASVVFIIKQIQYRKLPRLGPLALPMILYFAVCVFSTIDHNHPDFLVSMVQMILYMVMTPLLFCYFGKPGEDYRLALHGLIVVACLLSVAGLMTSSTYVLGLHKNGVGASVSAALVVALELWLDGKTRRYRIIMGFVLLLLSAELVHSLSRGAWMAAFVGLICITTIRRDYKLLIKSFLILAPAIAIYWALLSPASREYAMGFTADHENINARYKSMQKALANYQQNPVYGMGVGLRKEYDATNVVFLLLAETGILGLATFMFMHLVFLVVMYKTEKLLSPLDPFYSLPPLGAALLVGKLMNGMVDHYWSRGALTLAWATAGMALAAYYHARQNPQPALEEDPI